MLVFHEQLALHLHVISLKSSGKENTNNFISVRDLWFLVWNDQCYWLHSVKLYRYSISVEMNRHFTAEGEGWRRIRCLGWVVEDQESKNKRHSARPSRRASQRCEQSCPTSCTWWEVPSTSGRTISRCQPLREYPLEIDEVVLYLARVVPETEPID